ARASAIADEAAGDVGGKFMLWMRGHHQHEAIPADFCSDRYLPGELRHLEYALAAQNGLSPRRAGLGRAVENRFQLADLRIFHQQLAKEPVELGFRERIRALHLQRVLRRHDEERL